MSEGECVPAFTHESERGPFVPEVLKTVWTMCWKRWYDCVSCAFRAFFEDEKESRIKGWRRNRRSAQSLLPAVRAVDGGFNAGDCGAFYGTFWSGWRLSSRKRRCPKDFGGALWPFRKKIEVITSLKIGSAGQAYFESPQSMKRDFQAFKNRTAVTKEERLRQRKNCAAIGKEKSDAK